MIFGLQNSMFTPDGRLDVTKERLWCSLTISAQMVLYWNCSKGSTMTTIEHSWHLDSHQSRYRICERPNVSVLLSVSCFLYPGMWLIIKWSILVEFVDDLGYCRGYNFSLLVIVYCERLHWIMPKTACRWLSESPGIYSDVYCSFLTIRAGKFMTLAKL